jgi:hypothetical protein
MGFWIWISNFVLFVVNGLIKGEIEKLSCQCLGLIYDESLTYRFEFKSGTFRWFYYLYLVYVENYVCLSRGVQVAGVAWRAVMKIMAGVGDLVQRTGDDHTGQVLSGRTIERSGDTMCGLHHARENEECGFLGWASKLRSIVCQWFALKTTRTVCHWFDIKTSRMVFSDLASKPVAMVSSGWASKPLVSYFPVYALKPAGTVWRFELKIIVMISWFGS